MPGELGIVGHGREVSSFTCSTRLQLSSAQTFCHVDVENIARYKKSSVTLLKRLGKSELYDEVLFSILWCIV